MQANIHVHLEVSDIDESSAFYEKIFGKPVKVKPGYRKFLPSFAPLNLALTEAHPDGASTRAAAHFGVQFETSAEVTAQLARVKAAGVPVREEIGVSCCHANQDKFWVRDPDGAEWEFYSINFDLEEAAPPPAQGGCCPTTDAGRPSSVGSGRGS